MKGLALQDMIYRLQFMLHESKQFLAPLFRVQCF
jgi:hypothetical protein